MTKKWKQLIEFIEHIERDDTLTLCCKDCKKLTYAPNLGYHTWIFKYKDIMVALHDASNGHYAYLDKVGIVELVMAKISVFINHLRS